MSNQDVKKDNVQHLEQGVTTGVYNVDMEQQMMSDTTEIRKVVYHHLTEKRWVKNLLITIGVLFIVVMMIFPLVTVLVNALEKGFGAFIDAISTEFVLSATIVTIIATVSAVLINSLFGMVASWLLTKYDFRGKQFLSTLIDIPFSISPVIAGLAYIMTFGRIGWAAPFIEWINETLGTDFAIVGAIPGVIIATVFVTFPFVSREIIPVLNAEGKDEEEAAALMGAKGFRIFRKITFPHMKWALLYGIILCTARAMGEFGAVATLARGRGDNFTLPLEIDALYKGSVTTSESFAVSALLMIVAIVILIIKNIVEYRKEKLDK